MDELSRRERERAELLELARFKLAELERAAIAPAEDEELAASRAVLANAAKLAAAANEAQELLYGAQDAALDLIARAQARLGEAAAIDRKLNAPIELIASAAPEPGRGGAYGCAATPNESRPIRRGSNRSKTGSRS